MHLLDNNVVSAVRRPRSNPAVVAWTAGASEADLHLCAVPIGEIQAGIEITRDQDAAKAEELNQWLGRVMDTYRVLPEDGSALRGWARLMHRRSDTLQQDAMIAAAATVHRLAVATRNDRDFDYLEVQTVNPSC
ncbi:MAG: type II toxin-antitoxin system VapC family toxin [Chloroflexi bacterium]|nr:type II toxin-antitoxin system VapC family toxin [Chloroflexota bacterium]MYD48270.1 type II toxin-antitoxin system VapC family toxin [Chloroflexota bacterium]